MSNIAKAKLYKEAFDLMKQAQELLIAARKKHERQPAEGEDIMVNTPYDVFILPLRPSGLDGKGPRFVVHVPGPEQPAADQFIATFRCEDNGIVGVTDAKIHSVTRHDDGRIEVVIDHWPKQPAVHPAITHCDNCGCDWLDNGLNPVGCPYCKQNTWRAAFVAERATRYREGGMAVEQARIHAETEAAYLHARADLLRDQEGLL
jgi:hypothetical protein